MGQICPEGRSLPIPAFEIGRGCGSRFILFYELLQCILVAQTVKNLPAMQETQVQSLGREDLLEKGMATHSSILAWRIPWTGEPGGLQSTGLQRVRHDWATNTHTHTVRCTLAWQLNQPRRRLVAMLFFGCFLAGVMCGVHVMLRTSLWGLMCWVYLAIETEVWGLVYTHSQNVAELGFESRSPYPQALPILLIRFKGFCLDHVLGGLLVRLWEGQDLSASFPACTSSVLCRDSSALLRTQSGSCFWLARRPLRQSCLCCPGDLPCGQSWEHWAARSVVVEGVE